MQQNELVGSFGITMPNLVAGDLWQDLRVGVWLDDTRSAAMQTARDARRGSWRDISWTFYSEPPSPLLNDLFDGTVRSRFIEWLSFKLGDERVVIASASVDDVDGTCVHQTRVLGSSSDAVESLRLMIPYILADERAG